MGAAFTYQPSRGIIYVKYSGWVTAEEMMKMMEKVLLTFLEMEQKAEKAEKTGTPVPINERIIDIIGDFSESLGYVGQAEPTKHVDSNHLLSHPSAGELFIINITPEIAALLDKAQIGGLNGYTLADSVEEAEKIIFEKVKPLRNANPPQI